MHIAFLTVFLGLIAGPVPVELAVTSTPATSEASARSAIAAIEIVLDGRPVRGLAGPPWKTEVDLGKDLLPHHLEARALDAAGVELAHAEQWINLPQPLAAMNLTPETDPEGRISAARLSFWSETHEAPSAITATLDGSPLLVQPGRVTLPSYKPDLPHVLTVEGRFPSGLSVHRDLAFGGGLEGEVTTELTAVLVRTHGSLPLPAALAGGFVVNEASGAASRQLTVLAVEEGPEEILAVRDPGAAAALEILGTRESDAGRFRGDSWLKSELPIEDRDRIRLVDASASWFSGEGTTSAIFGVSPELDGRKWGLYWWLAHSRPSRPGSRPQLSDAVAVAGVQALADQHRRAVLLVLSGEPAEDSRWSAAAVRRYLAAIRVPLYVWSVRAPPYSAAVTAWGKVEDVSSFYQMSRAYRRLNRDLAAQRIVWLQGRHLPQSIALSSKAPKTDPSIELVAGPER